MNNRPIIPGRMGVEIITAPSPAADGGTVAVPSPGGVKIIQVGGLSIQEEIARGFLQAAFVGGQVQFADSATLNGDASAERVAALWRFREAVAREAVEWANAFLRVTRGQPANHEEANGGA